MRNAYAFAFILIATTFTSEVIAQRFTELDVSPMDMVAFPPSTDTTSEIKVRVIYSRPQLKGRPLSELTPADKIWRTGANESTEITFYTNAKMGGKDVAAGSYSLFTIPGEKNWTIILNQKLHSMGSHSYDESHDVLRMMVPSTTETKSLEAFSIGFKTVEGSTQMVLAWDKTRVAVPMQL